MTTSCTRDLQLRISQTVHCTSMRTSCAVFAGHLIRACIRISSAATCLLASASVGLPLFDGRLVCALSASRIPPRASVYGSLASARCDAQWLGEQPTCRWRCGPRSGLCTASFWATSARGRPDLNPRATTTSRAAAAATNTNDKSRASSKTAKIILMESMTFWTAGSWLDAAFGIRGNMRLQHD